MLAARLGAAALCLLVTIPFLVPFHTTPITSFHAEWLAAVLGLSASVALLGARRLPLPGVALLALALAALVGLQALLGRAPVPPLTELFALYLLWAALLACAASQVAQTFGKAKTAQVLAAAVLAGSMLAALAALLRPWLAQAGWPGFAPVAGGPLGQRNHFTDYLWLGLASALYLRSIERIGGATFWASAALLTLTAALCGQRSSFVYAMALIAVALWQARAWRGVAPAGGRRLAVGILLLFLVMQPAVVLLPKVLPSEGSTPPPALRAMTEISGPSIRLQLLGLGVRGIATAPLLGNGVGSFPSFALTFADDLPPADNPGPAEHGHNLLLDLAAELGLPAALAVLLGAIAWARGLRHSAEAPEAAWAMAVLAVLGLHSMIEYPLWHAYFLGLLALVAGAFAGHWTVGRRLTSVALTLGLIAWGCIALVGLARDYKMLEATLALGKNPATMPGARMALSRIPADSLLSPWVKTAACVSLEPSTVSIEDGLAVCDVAMSFAPTIESGANYATLLWRSGQGKQAIETGRRLALEFPSAGLRLSTPAP